MKNKKHKTQNSFCETYETKQKTQNGVCYTHELKEQKTRNCFYKRIKPHMENCPETGGKHVPVMHV